MQVNLNKLIASLLPTFLRKDKLITIIQVMASQLESALNWFQSQVPVLKKTANINASIISLEHHIKEQFDCDVVISELDGKPFDFLVTVSGFVDLDKLRSFVDKYKIAGRTFLFELGEVSYSCEFINHVCEWNRDDNAITAHSADGKVWATSAAAAYSNLEIIIRTVWSGGATVMYTVQLLKGQSTSNQVAVQAGTMTLYEINSVTPGFDNKYNYSY